VYSEEEWNRVGKWEVIIARSGVHWNKYSEEYNW